MRRVLLVDDEPLVRNVFRRWLIRSGFAVVEAGTVAAACEQIEQAHGRFDLVITDYRMPGLSGCDLVSWVRARWASLPIIMITAHADESLCGSRPDLLIEKPVTGDALGRAIQAVLGDLGGQAHAPGRSSPSAPTP